MGYLTLSSTNYTDVLPRSVLMADAFADEQSVLQDHDFGCCKTNASAYVMKGFKKARVVTWSATAILPLRQQISSSDCHMNRSLIVKACAPTGSLPTCKTRGDVGMRNAKRGGHASSQADGDMYALPLPALSQSLNLAAHTLNGLRSLTVNME